MPLMDLTHPSKIRLECEKDWCISCQPTKLTQVRMVMYHGVWKLQKSLILQHYKIEGCGQTVLLPVIFKRTKIGEKIPKFKNSNETFLLIFKQCGKAQVLLVATYVLRSFLFFPWLLKSSKKGSFFERIIMLELIPQSHRKTTKNCGKRSKIRA